MNLDRAKGSLLGLAVGDAVGTTQEFSRPGDRLPFPQLNLGPQTDLVGGGPFDLPAGHTTDDTQMAVCLARTLRGAEHLDVAAVGTRYTEWMTGAFDVGQQTRACLQQIGRGTPAALAGLFVWNAWEQEAAGNGSLMRTAPIGVYFCARPEERRRASWWDSAITHADPRCILACASLNAAIALGLNDESARAPQLHQAARAELPLLAAALSADPRWPTARVEAAVVDLSDDLSLAERDDPQLVVTKSQGFVRIAFRLAFWELLHTRNFAEAVLDVTNRGGDSDTNAAITGALVGALHGAAQIPEAWTQRVLAPADGEAFHERYHPRDLLLILDQ
ncbi:MAG: ADP-ribosylglycohydrolase family protein [Deltaproteobacteria bacterium]|nr:ADP-ribosylglycohydrolase family protein [Deltaproteobacteria bacterium]